MQNSNIGVCLLEVTRSAWAVCLHVVEYEKTRFTTHLCLMHFVNPGEGSFLCWVDPLLGLLERTVHLDLVRGVVKTVLLGAGVSQHTAHVCYYSLKTLRSGAYFKCPFAT